MSAYEALLADGLLLVSMGGNEGAALLRFERAQAEAPEGRGEAWLNAGVLLEQMGRYDEALRAFRTATLRQPELADAWRNLAFLQGRIDPMLGVFAWDDVLEQFPDDAVAWVNRGTLLEFLDDPAQALVSYRHAAALDPQLEAARNAVERLGGGGEQ